MAEAGHDGGSRAGTEPFSDGELGAAISSAISEVYARNLGREPERAESFHSDGVVVTFMTDPMTRPERTLIEDGASDTVLEARRRAQYAMREELSARIEQLTERDVQAMMSCNHADPDLAVEVFVLT